MPRGGFGGGGFRGGFRGGYGRRGGYPLMGGMGMGGMGMGSPLLTGLMGGGLGYLFGSNQNQPSQQQASQQQAPPSPPNTGPTWPDLDGNGNGNADGERLAQLKLLGELHTAGTLTDDEFTREKQRLLRGG